MKERLKSRSFLKKLARPIFTERALDKTTLYFNVLDWTVRYRTEPYSTVLLNVLYKRCDYSLCLHVFYNNLLVWQVVFGSWPIQLSLDGPSTLRDTTRLNSTTLH